MNLKELFENNAVADEFNEYRYNSKLGDASVRVRPAASGTTEIPTDDTLIAHIFVADMNMEEAKKVAPPGRKKYVKYLWENGLLSYMLNFGHTIYDHIENLNYGLDVAYEHAVDYPGLTTYVFVSKDVNIEQFKQDLILYGFRCTEDGIYLLDREDAHNVFANIKFLPESHTRLIKEIIKPTLFFPIIEGTFRYVKNCERFDAERRSMYVCKTELTKALNRS